jgi:S1-C subfamily serine protease
MRRILTTLALLALLVAPSFAALNPYTYLRSVSVLQTAGRNMCSVTAINKEYYLTAAHCVVANFPTAEAPLVDETPNDNLTIDGRQAHLLDVDVLQDLAVLEVPGADRPALKLAKVSPRLLEKVTMAGHPFGWDFPTVMVGTVAALSLRFTTDPADFPFTKHYMILQVSGAPGNSGSSVVNEKLEVVSVVQINWGRAFEPVMGSAPFAELARFAGKYFAK